jgi:tetratricopeptide (TPR) repeat protein
VGAAAGAGDYPQRLGEEWQAQLAAAEDDLKEQGLDPGLWQTIPTIRTLKDFIAFVLRATREMKHLKGRTVIYLRPENYADETAFVSMIEQVLRDGLPENVLLMVHAFEESAASQRLAGRQDWGVVTIRPNLNMAAAATEIAAASDPTDPAVQFRVLFLEMSNLGGQRAFEKMREVGTQASELAQQQPGWEHMVATVLAAQGAHLLTSKNRREEALNFFQQARRAAVIAENSGNPAGRAVHLQTLNFEAAGLFHLKDFVRAAGVYTEAAKLAGTGKNDAFHEMEAHRMAGYCHYRAGNNPAAWNNYQSGLTAAERIDPATLRGSTLPYLGRGLLQLVALENRHAAAGDIRRRLEQLLGPDWETLIEQAEKPIAS